MSLTDDLERVAAAAEALAAPGERLAGVVAAEPLGVGRVYLCAYESADGSRAWLALDGAAVPLADARAVRDAAQLAALCEVAAEAAGGEQLDELRVRLAELRETDRPQGIEEAEAAAAAVAGKLADEPRVATTAFLDELGALARELEQALGTGAASPFAQAMQQALPAVEQVAAHVADTYKGRLT
jgi:hypothetical protein